MAKSARVEALPNMKPYFYRGKFTPALINTVLNDPDAKPENSHNHSNRDVANFGIKGE